MHLRQAAIPTVLILSSLPASTQTPVANWTPPAGTKVDRMYFNSKLGSLKFIDGVGQVKLNFTGTVLVSRLKGNISVSGKLRKEFQKGDRVAYFGTGSITVTGQFRGVQFFGRDVSGEWYGAGIGRLYGEFDDKLNTGSYWFASDPTKKFWSPYGTTFLIPPQNFGATGVPQERPKDKP